MCSLVCTLAEEDISCHRLRKLILILRLLLARIVTARIGRLSERKVDSHLSGLFAGMRLAGLIMQEFL